MVKRPENLAASEACIEAPAGWKGSGSAARQFRLGKSCRSASSNALPAAAVHHPGRRAFAFVRVGNLPASALSSRSKGGIVMHARRPDFVSERQTVLDLAALPDARVPKRHDSAHPPERSAETAGEPKPRRTPRWPAAALVAALALNGLWVALLLWLVGRWIGAV
jgi:hypothetical protein